MTEIEVIRICLEHWASFYYTYMPGSRRLAGSESRGKGLGHVFWRAPWVFPRHATGLVGAHMAGWLECLITQEQTRTLAPGRGLKPSVPSPYLFDVLIPTCPVSSVLSHLYHLHHQTFTKWRLYIYLAISNTFFYIYIYRLR